MPNGAMLVDNNFKWIPDTEQIGTHFLPFCVNDGNQDAFAIVKITVTDGQTTVPEFPSLFLSATMIIGVLGAVLLFQRTREH